MRLLEGPHAQQKRRRQAGGGLLRLAQASVSGSRPLAQGPTHDEDVEQIKLARICYRCKESWKDACAANSGEQCLDHLYLFLLTVSAI